MKNILIINGHPDAQSYNQALADAYYSALRDEANKAEIIHIRDLEFNPSLAFGYRKRMNLEPDLLEAIEKIKKADHLVWFMPMWWSGIPAQMKGFIDRTFLPGITYQPIEGKPLPRKLLKGKSARIVITGDSPGWYNYLYMKRPLVQQMKKGVLQYCGVSPVKVTYIGPIKNSSDSYRQKWLNKMRELALAERN